MPVIEGAAGVFCVGYAFWNFWVGIAFMGCYCVGAGTRGLMR